MQYLERLESAELEDLSQLISVAIDSSINEECYTILDEIENILAVRSVGGEHGEEAVAVAKPPLEPFETWE
jgi:hypothetical protein